VSIVLDAAIKSLRDSYEAVNTIVLELEVNSNAQQKANVTLQEENQTLKFEKAKTDMRHRNFMHDIRETVLRHGALTSSLKTEAITASLSYNSESGCEEPQAKVPKN